MKYRNLLSISLLMGISGVTSATELPAVDCVITPSKSVDLSVATSGVIRHLHADRSDEVKKGDLLVELNSTVEEESVKLARIKADMNAEISAEKINLQYDRLQNERIRNLKEKHLVSNQNIDESKRSEQVSYWRLQQAKDTYTVRQQELKKAIAQLNNTRVYAPFDGVVTQVYKSEGEYVENTPVLQLVQLNPLYVEAVLGMEYFGQVHKKMLADVFPETTPNNPYQAQVTLIDRVGDTASGTFGVRLTMDNPGSHIASGVKCVMKLDLDKFGDTETSDVSKNDTLNALQEPIEQESTAVNDESFTTDQVAKVDNKMTEEIELSGAEVASYKFGPFTDDDQLNHAKAVIDSLGFSYTALAEQTDLIKGYLVLSSNSYSQPSKILMASFKQQGVSDMMIMPQQNYQSRISFGAYNGPMSAEARKQSLHKKGIRTEVVARKEQEPSIWLNVKNLTEEKIRTILNRIEA